MKIDTERVALLVDLIGELMRQHTVPGLGLAVVSKEGIEYARAFGVSSLRTMRPFTTNTPYGIGSSSKTIAALAVLQLCDEGAIALTDRPVFIITARGCFFQLIIKPRLSFIHTREVSTTGTRSKSPIVKGARTVSSFSSIPSPPG